MASQMNTVRKGGSLPFVFDRDGESIDGWVCTIKVKKFPGDVASISRVIESVDLTWPGVLTSSETALLASGETMLIGVITNASEDREQTPVIRFYVTEEL